MLAVFSVFGFQKHSCSPIFSWLFPVSSSLCIAWYSYVFCKEISHPGSGAHPLQCDLTLTNFICNTLVQIRSHSDILGVKTSTCLLWGTQLHPEHHGLVFEKSLSVKVNECLSAGTLFRLFLFSFCFVCLCPWTKTLALPGCQGCQPSGLNYTIISSDCPLQDVRACHWLASISPLSLYYNIWYRT